MTPRIASLVPSASEIVCALGLRAQLVGRSHECDFPASLAALPALTRARVPDGASAAIDAAVREQLASGLSLYDVDTAALRRLAPDLLLTQSQCDVCAPSASQVEAALADALDHPVELLSLAPRTLADVWDDIQRVGEAAGAAARARELRRELAERMAEVGEAVGGGGRPDVLLLEWLDPPMGAGHWLPELARVAGARPVLAAAGGDSRRLEPEAIAAADPDWLVLCPCGFPLERAAAEWRALALREPWCGLAAVRAGRVAVADGSAFFNRPGPRLVESAEILCDVFAEADRFGHRGVAWRLAGRD